MMLMALARTMTRCSQSETRDRLRPRRGLNLRPITQSDADKVDRKDYDADAQREQVRHKHVETGLALPQYPGEIDHPRGYGTDKCHAVNCPLVLFRGPIPREKVGGKKRQWQREGEDENHHFPNGPEHPCTIFAQTDRHDFVFTAVIWKELDAYPIRRTTGSSLRRTVVAPRSFEPSQVARYYGQYPEQLGDGAIDPGLCRPLGKMLEWPIERSKTVQTSAIDGIHEESRRLLAHCLLKPLVELGQIV
jgi:hypothetical protein